MFPSEKWGRKTYVESPDKFQETRVGRFLSRRYQCGWFPSEDQYAHTDLRFTRDGELWFIGEVKARSITMDKYAEYRVAKEKVVGALVEGRDLGVPAFLFVLYLEDHPNRLRCVDLTVNPDWSGEWDRTVNSRGDPYDREDAFGWNIRSTMMGGAAFDKLIGAQR